jgi:hypothetical protein
VFNCHVRVLPWLEKEINNFLQKSVDSPSALWQTWRMTTKIEIPPMVESQCWKVGDELFMDRHKALVERVRVFIAGSPPIELGRDESIQIATLLVDNSDALVAVLQDGRSAEKPASKPRRPHQDWSKVDFGDKDEDIARTLSVTLRTVRKARAKFAKVP